MEKVIHSDPADITGQMKKRFGSPDVIIQSRKAISVSEAIGHAELGYYRGVNSGIFDAYLTIQQKYPEVAKELLKAFNMRDNNGEWEVIM